MTMVSVGEFGTYQRRVFALLCLVGIPFSFFDTGPILWARVPEYHCNDSQLVNYKQKSLYTTEKGGNNRINIDGRNTTKDATNEAHDDNGMNLEDTFAGKVNERCFQSSLNKAKDEVTSPYGHNEGHYCANYSFQAATTTIVAKVSADYLRADS